MLIKVGSWKQGLLRFKQAGQWLKPDKMMTKHNGIWAMVEGLELVVLNQLSDILPNTANWAYDATRGWYRDVYEWTNYQQSKFTPEFLSKIRKVSVAVTGYYNVPSDCMGVNILNIKLSNGTTMNIGTSDGWDLPSSGHSVYKGDAGVENNVTRNIVGERFTCTIPEGVTVTGISINSGGYYYSTTGRYYAFSLRGLKDFEFTLGY